MIKTVQEMLKFADTSVNHADCFSDTIAEYFEFYYISWVGFTSEFRAYAIAEWLCTDRSVGLYVLTDNDNNVIGYTTQEYRKSDIDFFFTKEGRDYLVNALEKHSEDKEADYTEIAESDIRNFEQVVQKFREKKKEANTAWN